MLIDLIERLGVSFLDFLQGPRWTRDVATRPTRARQRDAPQLGGPSPGGPRARADVLGRRRLGPGAAAGPALELRSTNVRHQFTMPIVGIWPGVLTNLE